MKKLSIVFMGLLSFGYFTVHGMDKEPDVTIKMAFTQSKKDFWGTGMNPSTQAELIDKGFIPVLANFFQDLESTDVLSSFLNDSRNVKSGEMVLTADMVRSSDQAPVLVWNGKITLHGTQSGKISSLNTCANDIEDELRQRINLHSFQITTVPYTEDSTR